MERNLFSKKKIDDWKKQRIKSKIVAIKTFYQLKRKTTRNIKKFEKRKT